MFAGQEGQEQPTAREEENNFEPEYELGVFLDRNVESKMAALGSAEKLQRSTLDQSISEIHESCLDIKSVITVYGFRRRRQMRNLVYGFRRNYGLRISIESYGNP